MSFESVIGCDLCDDVPAIFSKRFVKNLCSDCFRELETGQLPPMEKVTSGRVDLSLTSGWSKEELGISEDEDHGHLCDKEEDEEDLADLD